MINNEKRVYLDCNEKFIQEWIDRARAEENKDSDLTQFFCYFIIFNYLYSSLGYQNKIIISDSPKIDEREKKSKNQKEINASDLSRKGERKMISELIKYYYDNNSSDCFKSPYRLINKTAELRKIVTSEKSKKKPDEIKKFQDLLNIENIDQLFQNIYTIRCNLFHGAKSMFNSRNIKLIKESNIVLSDFLNQVISNY